MALGDYRGERGARDARPGSAGPSAAGPDPIPRPLFERGWEGEDEEATERRFLFLSRLDLEQFKFFYYKYYAEIRTHLHRMCRDPDLAKDLASETFWRAQRSLGRFRWRGRPYWALLYTIAYNCYRRKLKEQGRWMQDEQPLDELESGGQDAESRAIHQEERDLLYACLDLLSAKDQQVVALYLWDEMDAREIARVLGCSESAAKSRCYRARDRLMALVAARREEQDRMPPSAAPKRGKIIRFPWQPRRGRKRRGGRQGGEA